MATLIQDAPVELAVDADTLARCVDEILACASACTACSSACLAEEDVAELRDCVATNDVCAEVCFATARVVTRLARGSYDILAAQLRACVVACRVCADECRQHAEHQHCGECATACERAERAANTILDALPQSAAA